MASSSRAIGSCWLDDDSQQSPADESGTPEQTGPSQPVAPQGPPVVVAPPLVGSGPTSWSDDERKAVDAHIAQLELQQRRAARLWSSFSGADGQTHGIKDRGSIEKST